MTTMGKHSEPISGAVSNGHALVPFTVPRGPVSGWPQDDPGQSRTVADARAEPDKPGRPRRRYPWPLLAIAAPAAVAVWSGWVGLGGLCGFGPVRLLPGIVPGFVVNTAITLPVGVEAYGAYALYVWLAGRVSVKTRRFARNSAFAALGLGCLGQVVYHLLAAARWAEAPWGVVVAVSCLPVLTLSFAAALVHMTLADARQDDSKGDDAVHVERPVRLAGGKTYCACGWPWPCPHAVQPAAAPVVPPPADNPVDKPADRQADKPPPRVSTPARTARDKAAAAIRRHPDWTDAALARSAGVSTKTVQRARNSKTGSTP